MTVVFRQPQAAVAGLVRSTIRQLRRGHPARPAIIDAVTSEDTPSAAAAVRGASFDPRTDIEPHRGSHACCLVVRAQGGSRDGGSISRTSTPKARACPRPRRRPSERCAPCLGPEVRAGPSRQPAATRNHHSAASFDLEPSGCIAGGMLDGERGPRCSELVESASPNWWPRREPSASAATPRCLGVGPSTRQQNYAIATPAVNPRT